jgi:malonate-semialdehyde dehydrogenase (acetylating)/methylmalonate-semialdehyde dehydrogenase
MVPLWFYPFAVVCGNTFVCKPSEQVPLSQKFLFELIDDVGFPPGVLNLVHGGKDAVNAIVEHPLIQGVSFVGSRPVAEHVYKSAATHGKRVQALGGANNFLVVMPDAEMGDALDAIIGSAYGCAGERCLAGSVVLAVGNSHDQVREGLRERIEKIRVGDGSSPETTMGPVISAKHLERVLGYIEKGVEEGAELVVDGRNLKIDGDGYFVGPTLFDRVTPEMTVTREEIFGPVLCMMAVETLDAAIKITRDHPLANATSIFRRADVLLQLRWHQRIILRRSQGARPRVI